MLTEEMKLKITQGSRIEIALECYDRFKETNEHDESYKAEILGPMNEYLQSTSINSENVIEIVKYFQRNNPTSGSFVHWSNIDDLLKFATHSPDEVAGLFHLLYDHTIDLVERIEHFYNKGKQFNANLNLGAPLFAYLLAAHDIRKYTLYKDEMFRSFLKSCGINMKLGNISKKYAFYLQVCEVLLEKLRERDPQATLLDAQDFMYSTELYVSLRTEIAVKFLHHFSQKLDQFKNDDALFLEAITNHRTEDLIPIRNLYVKGDKINKIRHDLLNRILSGESVTLQTLEDIKESIKQQHDKNILRAWDNFKILFTLYYNPYKEVIDNELRKIHQAIIGIEDFKQINFHSSKTINNFSWKQNFGDTSCWVAGFPNNYSSHKQAAQLFVKIEPEYVAYGLALGSDIEEKRTDEDFEYITNIDEFTFTRMKDKLIQVFPKFKQWNQLEYQEENGEDLNITSEAELEQLPTQNTLNSSNSTVHLMPKVDFSLPLQLGDLLFENKEVLERQIHTALLSGKHIIFIGPPGTGKSKLAKAVCESFDVPYKMVTATSDWSSYDTMGGYRPNQDGTLTFAPGIFLECLKDKSDGLPKNDWLIIDELNRADIDKAFGSMFSVLTGDPVRLPYQADNGKQVELVPQDKEAIKPMEHEYYVPRDWRLIGTMNTSDKASLYELSYAFMRRFAFIPVTVPSNIHVELVEQYLNIWGLSSNDCNPESLASIWRVMNKYRKIGPAIIEDLARYLVLDSDYTSAIILYIMPQLEGLMEHEIKEFLSELTEMEFVDKDPIIDFASDFFDIEGRL